jgi:formate-dependent phosphoribosylglycinamide formyltransferase (GAR transformylase)
MKKIAVLGAGYYNINVYKKLKEGGFYTIAFDGNKDAPAAEFADEFVNMNFSDKNSVSFRPGGRNDKPKTIQPQNRRKLLAHRICNQVSLQDVWQVQAKKHC